MKKTVTIYVDTANTNYSDIAYAVGKELVTHYTFLDGFTKKEIEDFYGYTRATTIMLLLEGETIFSYGSYKIHFRLRTI